MVDDQRDNSDEKETSEPQWEAQIEARRAMAGESTQDDAAAQLHAEATARIGQRSASSAEINFGRQMLQLVLIPALIVAGVLGVWLVLVTLGGQSQELSEVLEKLARTGENVPRQQERSRMMMSLLSYVEEHDKLTTDEREMLVEQLPQIARQRIDGSNEQRAIMGAMAILGDASSIPVFKEFLDSDDEKKWFAAVSGLHGWRGDMNVVRPLVPDLIKVLRRAPRPPSSPIDDAPIDALPAITISVLATAATPGDQAVIDVLAEQLGNATGANRDLEWNARCALAVLGDERGLPGVRSLLNREWLSEQLMDPRDQSKGLISQASQRKILASTINVVVGFDPHLKGYAIRIDDPGVWALIEGLAQKDPNPDIRDLARSALVARDQRPQSEVGDEPDSSGIDDGGGG